MDSISPATLVQALDPTWREIPLTKGLVAIVDAADYERVAAFKWCLTAGRYAGRKDPLKRGGRIYLHRWLMEAGPGTEVDHRNRNSLDNRRENLRFCTHAQNLANRLHIRPSKTSRFRGVHMTACGRWRCAINRLDRGEARQRQVHVGYFLSELDAAIAYDRAAIQYHGDFAVLNFPRENYT